MVDSLIASSVGRVDDTVLRRAAILLLKSSHAFAFGFAQRATIAVSVVFIIVIKRIDVAGVGAWQWATFTDGAHCLRFCSRALGTTSLLGGL